MCTRTNGTWFAASFPAARLQLLTRCSRAWQGSPPLSREEGVQPTPAVTMPAHKKGDFLVDYEEKVFEDVKAEPGEKALVTFHTVAFEGSIGLVHLLQALRLQRKRSRTSTL